jgi:hypothetical protein
VGKINYFDFFYEAAASGDLPPYTFLDPRWFTFFEWEASDQHPPHDVRPGTAARGQTSQSELNSRLV